MNNHQDEVKGFICIDKPSGNISYRICNILWDLRQPSAQTPVDEAHPLTEALDLLLPLLLPKRVCRTVHFTHAQFFLPKSALFSFSVVEVPNVFDPAKYQLSPVSQLSVAIV